MNEKYFYGHLYLCFANGIVVGFRKPIQLILNRQQAYTHLSLSKNHGCDE